MKCALADIQPPITQHMSMKCALADIPALPTSFTTISTSTSGGLVGRDVDDVTSRSDDVTSRSDDVMERAADAEKILHVTGISISRGGTMIATVTTYTSATIEDGVTLGDVEVTGGVAQTDGQLG